MATGEVSLKCGRLELVLAPATGGSIARFDWIDGNWRTPVLRGTDPTNTDVLAMGSFPLVPYVNRVRGGCFTFRRREVRLEPNMAADPSPLHGQGWLRPWTVESDGATEAVPDVLAAAGAGVDATPATQTSTVPGLG